MPEYPKFHLWPYSWGPVRRIGGVAGGLLQGGQPREELCRPTALTPQLAFEHFTGASFAGVALARSDIGPPRFVRSYAAPQETEGDAFAACSDILP